MWSSSNFSVRIIPDALQAACRIIPADAGSTSASQRIGPTARDHPRGCGEHRLEDQPTDTGEG
ncbi:hypothetical protein, partial [Bifidobacterium sp. wkB344]|uniref:hypothetical protein n=1 Tax=Bifidobacterium sp. wkB344 TaxID=2025113 RepID=UPI001C7CD791